MLLTDAERQRFTEWLKQDIESNRLLLRNLTQPFMEPIAKMKRQLIAAEIVVLKELDSAEQMTL